MIGSAGVATGLDPVVARGLVAATVAGGRFAFWFPGDELEDRETVPVEVTYADGSTATVKLEL